MVSFVEDLHHQKIALFDAQCDMPANGAGAQSIPLSVIYLENYGLSMKVGVLTDMRDVRVCGGGPFASA